MTTEYTARKGRRKAIGDRLVDCYINSQSVFRSHMPESPGAGDLSDF